MTHGALHDPLAHVHTGPCLLPSSHASFLAVALIYCHLLAFDLALPSACNFPGPNIHSDLCSRTLPRLPCLEWVAHLSLSVLLSSLPLLHSIHHSQTIKKNFFFNLFIFGCIGSSLLYEGFSLRWLLIAVASLVAEHGLQARGLQQLWHVGFVTPRHVGSSQTRVRTRVPCIGRQILHHCATREVPLLDDFYCPPQNVIPQSRGFFCFTYHCIHPATKLPVTQKAISNYMLNQ